jgi:16S rRNA (guanine966-N2)-methyltransferase
MLRQALFNSIQGLSDGAHVLDLFAGSGALGFEALSRGAQRATFVESAPLVAQVIQKNAAKLGVQEQVRVLQEDVLRVLGRPAQLRGPFDLVFCDPPYRKDFERKVIEHQGWETLLSEEARLFIEHAVQDEEFPEKIGVFLKVREKRYGDTVLTTYKKVAL